LTEPDFTGPDLEPADFDLPKDLEEEMVEFAIAMNDLLDKGVSQDEVHEYVDMIYDENIRTLLLTVNNGRMDD
jgi:hypothetical protein